MFEQSSELDSYDIFTNFFEDSSKYEFFFSSLFKFICETTNLVNKNFPEFVYERNIKKGNFNTYLEFMLTIPDEKFEIWNKNFSYISQEPIFRISVDYDDYNEEKNLTIFNIALEMLLDFNLIRTNSWIDVSRGICTIDNKSFIKGTYTIREDMKKEFEFDALSTKLQNSNSITKNIKNSGIF